DYPQEVSDLMAVGLLKMYSEQALIETIKREKDSVYITFSKSAPGQIPVQELFRALDGIPLKADVSPEEGHYVVILKLKKQMKPYTWLDYLIRFAKRTALYLEEKEEAAAET